MSRRADLVDLDDLFAAEEAALPMVPSATVPSVRGAARWLLGRGFFSVALGTVIFGVLWVVRVGVPYPLIVGAIFVITVLRRSLARMDIRALPAGITGHGLLSPHDPWPGHAGAGDGRTPDGAQVAVGRWESRLSHRGSDAERVTRIVLPRLRDLVDERLRLRHGLTMTADPDRARQLLGERLWTMIHQPPRRGFTPQDMSVLVDQMEAL